MPARQTPVHRFGARVRALARGPVRNKQHRLAAVIDLLEKNLGTPIWDGPKSGLEVLVLTILSQNTTDANALAAYRNLTREMPTGLTRQDTLPRHANGEIDKVRLRLSSAAAAVSPPDWRQVAQLPAGRLAPLIRAAGLPAAKAQSILDVLAWLKPFDFELERALGSMSQDDAIAAMTRIKGVGVKTAAVTLIEAFGADLCPVDTHVHRIAHRLGLASPRASRDKTFAQLRAMIPAGRAFALHHNLLTFGRTVCTARQPKCGQCPLARLCPSSEAPTSRPRKAR
jgi:endonuclease-3